MPYTYICCSRIQGSVDEIVHAMQSEGSLEANLDRLFDKNEAGRAAPPFSLECFGASYVVMAVCSYGPFLSSASVPAM